MTLYVGIKLVNAEPMDRKDYNDFRKWTLPSDEDGDDEGYLVEYLDGGEANTEEYDGYVSWSPDAVFANAYKASDEGSLPFGAAIELAKLGCKVSRTGWNCKGMYAYIVPAKGLYRAYWELFTAQKDFAKWAPSGSDSLSEDWFILP